jgi:hypothetical protein
VPVTLVWFRPIAYAEPMVERQLDPVPGREELVEGAIPGIELAGRDADPPPLVPVGEEASSPAVADEVGLEPAGQAVHAGRGDEAVGGQASTKARSAKESPPAGPRCRSRIARRPNGSKKARTAGTGPRVEAPATGGAAGSPQIG